MQKITSRFLNLNTRDFLKGLTITIGSAVFAMVAESIQKEQFTFNFTSIWHTGVAAGVTYLSKQLFITTKTASTFQ